MFAFPRSAIFIDKPTWPVGFCDNEHKSTNTGMRGANSRRTRSELICAAGALARFTSIMNLAFGSSPNSAVARVEVTKYPPGCGSVYVSPSTLTRRVTRAEQPSQVFIIYFNPRENYPAIRFSPDAPIC